MYCRQLRNRVLTDRIADTLPFLERLRTATVPIAAKLLNICQTLLARALYTCESAQVGKSHLDKLRTGVMRAPRWDRKGAAPQIRLGLCNLQVDPFWYQLWRTISLFKQQCQKSHTIRDCWGHFSQHCQDGDTHGPFGKLNAELHKIGLVLGKEGKLWHSVNGSIDSFGCSDNMLKQVLQTHFQKSIPTNKIAQRL